MKINLNDIPQEGRSYKLDRTETELNPCLDDLIQKADYTTEFTIRPLTVNSRDFEMKGWIKTETPEVCSRCGIDFQHPINAKFHEFLIPKQDQPRGSRYAHVNHVSELSEGPETVEYEGQEFDLGEYLHEVIAMAVPFNVACPENAANECRIYENPEGEQGFSVNKDIPLEKPESPFAALKNLKLN